MLERERGILEAFCSPFQANPKTKAADLTVAVIRVFSDQPPGIPIGPKILFFL